jgi:hypothetical protein
LLKILTLEGWSIAGRPSDFGKIDPSMIREIIASSGFTKKINILYRAPKLHE